MIIDESLACARSGLISRYLLAATVIAVCVCLFLPSASMAAPPLSAAAPPAAEVTASTPNALPGFSFSDGEPATVLRVSVSTDAGTLSMADSPTGLTLASGFSSWTGEAEIAFTGLQANINAALATLVIDPGSTTGITAHVQLNAQPFVAGLAYSPDNGHYYQYFADSGVDFDTARIAALTQSYGGQTGYLATIPSTQINDLIGSKIPGAENVWIGALATNNLTPGAPIKRTWEWVDGPLAGTDILQCSNLEGDCTAAAGPWPLHSLWASGEPNNYDQTETAAVTNWGSIGEWNDLPQSGYGGDGYVVEYGDLATGSSTPFDGTASASVSLSVIGPSGSPTGVTVTTHGDKATVSWSPPSNDGGRPIVSYQVTASGGGGSCTAVAPATSCIIDGLTIGGNYTFTVTADNGLGSSGSSSPSSLVTPVTAIPEPASDPIVSIVDGSTVQVSWTPSADDGGESVTYTVVAEPGGQSCTSSTGSCTISGLQPGQTYSFAVTASNSAGSATASVSASVRLPTAAAPSSRPILTNVAFASHRARPASRRANLLSDKAPKRSKRKGKKSGGVKLSLTSSKRASLRFQIVRNIPGRNRAGKCMRRRTGIRRGAKCTISRPISVRTGVITIEQGANTLWFAGRNGSKRLAPGLYHLTFTLVDADGNVSNSRGDWVRVLKRR